MPDFINTEHCVEKLFPVGTTFSFEGKNIKLHFVGNLVLRVVNVKQMFILKG